MRRLHHLLSPLPLAVLVSTLAVAFLAGLVPTFTAAKPAAAAPSHQIVLPIDPARLADVYWSDTWGAARSGGRSHIGVDMMGPKMVPLVAAASGEVTWGRFNNDRGSIVRLRADDGWEYQYIHINNDTPGTDDGRASCSQALSPALCSALESDGDIKRGTRIEAGDLIGYLGDSGNAEWTAPHLHFEIYAPTGNGVTAVNPTSYVDNARTIALSTPDERYGRFENEAAAVASVFTGLEGRTATSVEREAFVSRVEGQDLSVALADKLRANPSSAQVDRLYEAFFRRQADSDGLNYWVEQRGDGRTLESVAEWFAESDEFERRYGHLDFGDFLDLLYRDVLNRPSDPDGKAYWLDQLSDGEVTRGTIVVYFSEGNELRTGSRVRNELSALARVFYLPQPTSEQVQQWATERRSQNLQNAIERWFLGESPVM